MRDLKGSTLYGMPYVLHKKGVHPSHWQKVMAQKYIYSGQWRKIDWYDWVESHEYYFNESDIAEMI